MPELDSPGAASSVETEGRERLSGRRTLTISVINASTSEGQLSTRHRGRGHSSCDAGGTFGLGC